MRRRSSLSYHPPEIEWLLYAQSVSHAKGDPAKALAFAKQRGYGDSVLDLLDAKAYGNLSLELRGAVGAMTSDNPASAGALAAHSLSVAYADTLVNDVLFDALRVAGAWPMPPGVNFNMIAALPTSSVGAQATWRAVSKIAVEGVSANLQNAMGLVVITDDVLKFSGPVCHERGDESAEL